jgi:hypothetical protein
MIRREVSASRFFSLRHRKHPSRPQRINRFACAEQAAIDPFTGEQRLLATMHAGLGVST